MTSGVVAVGFFDGVHLGHRAILDGADVAVTFSNHPLSVLDPGKAPPLLVTPGMKDALIRECGVRTVEMLRFDRELADVPASVFMERLRGAGEIRCGRDWRFGRNGEGNAGFLRRNGFNVKVAEEVSLGGERISSTRIRRALAAGRIADANAMLGRPWTMAGNVVRGKGLGSKAGFPTVNAVPCAGIVFPACGVYLVKVGSAPAVANFGYAPTMGADAWKEPVLEIHFGKAPDAPFAEGDFVAAEFLRFIRPERRFASREELFAQIAEDRRCIL